MFPALVGHIYPQYEICQYQYNTFCQGVGVMQQQSP